MPLTCFEMTQNYRANIVTSVVKVGKESLFQFCHSTCTGGRGQSWVLVLAFNFV